MLYRIYAFIFYFLIVCSLASAIAGAVMIITALFSWSKIIGWIVLGICLIWAGLGLFVWAGNGIDDLNKKSGGK